MPPKTLDKKGQSWQHCEIFQKGRKWDKISKQFLLPLVFIYEKPDFSQIFIDTEMFGKNWHHLKKNCYFINRVIGKFFVQYYLEKS
jgi:hypothetical protein